MDPTLVIILRLIHIVVGVFWVGGAITTAFFILPTVRATGPIGGQFAGQLMQRTRLPTMLIIAGLINVAAGIALYWGLYSDIAGTSVAIAFAIGGAIAIVVLVIGFVVAKPAADKMAAIGQTIARQGSPPTAEQAATREALTARLARAAALNAILLIVAVGFMAVARYVG